MKKIFLTTILSLAFLLSIFSDETVKAAQFSCNQKSGCRMIEVDDVIQAQGACPNGVASKKPCPAPTPSTQPPPITAQEGCRLNSVGQEICSLENPLEGDKTEVTQIISTVIKTALGIIGALALLMLVWGGFQWLTSAGNPEKVKSGTQTVIWAIIGVILVFSSYILLATFTNLLAGG